MKQASPFGRFCRLKRRENRQLLIQMADAMGVSSETLSEAELGERRIPAGWLTYIQNFLRLTEFEMKVLENAIKKSNSSPFFEEVSAACSSAAFRTGQKTGKDYH